MTLGGILLRLGFFSSVAAGLAAVWIQDHSGALPLGLFNQAQGLYTILSNACAGAGLALWALFGAELVLRRPLGAARAARAILLFLLSVEVLLFALDVGFVSRGSARLGGPYREVRGPDGAWVALKKARAGSPFGFRTSHPFARQVDRPRLLFLGDSYTEGSGRAAACNYPEVAGETFAEERGTPVEVMNAGVAGYGPEDALHLLRLLIAEGFRFDAVVYSLFLENDFTDNLPGTERRVVGGILDRFPQSAFLRALHPLNTRLFRWSLIVGRTSRVLRGAPEAVRREEGTCRLEAEPQSDPFPAPELRRLVLRRLAASYAPGARIATEEVAHAVAGMQAEARSLGIPFALVVFPDRVLADVELRAALAAELSADAYDLERLRRFVARAFSQPPVIDAGPALSSGRENYRAGDTHLSDLGNLRAGRFVGRTLASTLTAGGLPLGRRP